MKLDKTTLLKHKFWVLLLVSVPLSLGGIFLLVTAVSGEINVARTRIENETKKYVKPLDIKTPADIEKASLEAEIEKEKEKIVWAQAYEEQKDLFTWPELVEERYNFRSGLFAQKIKVYRGKAEPPPETAKNDRVMQGVVRASKGYYIEVETKDKQRHKLFESIRVEKNISVEGDDKAKDTTFGNIKVNDKVIVDFHRGKYFYEPLTNDEISTYKRNDLEKGYLSQIDPILEQVDPMTETGEGVVQLKGWFYKKGAAASYDLPSKKFGQQKFINYLEQGWAGGYGGDISEQAWLAQEDIWVQREIYRLIRLANDYVSKFERVNTDVKADDKTKVHTFKNPYWELGLKLDGANKLTIVLKNLLHRRQKLDVKFRIVFNEDRPAEVIDIGGLPLGPAGTEDATRTETRVFKDTLPRKGIYDVEQVLTWETAAVKRIDQISVGSLAPDEFSHSHRTFAYDQKAPPKKIDANAPAPIVPVVPVAPPRPGKKITGPRDNGGNELTPYELIRNRYSELTPQLSRRIPVSLALIVDQDHVFRVMRAFNNSKLRFLTTQVLENRYTSSIRPQLPALDVKTGPLPDPRRRFIAPPPPPSDELETNVELVLYGIVTLYERFPPPLAP